jgi:hypothetical protein
MHVFHVKPVSTNRWKIHEEAEDRYLSTFSDQTKAVEHAIEFARAHVPSQVIVYSDDGSVTTEYLYGEQEFPGDYEW